MRFIPLLLSCQTPRLLVLLALCLTGMGSLEAQVEITHCGQVIIADAVMTGDLVCESEELEELGIDIAASNVTLDMGGHVLSGRPLADNPLGIGIRAMHADGVTVLQGVTIRNGTIESFLSGLDLVNTSGVTVEGMTIRNMFANDPEDFIPLMRVAHSEDVVVRDSFFESLWVVHKEAIVLADSEVIIDNVEIRNNSVGVNVSGNSTEGTTATIINSRFIDVNIAGVLVQVTQNSRIASNEFIRNEVGIKVDSYWLEQNRGIIIENNHMHSGYVGVLFLGTINSSILNNDIRNVWRGISLQSNMECMHDITGPECFYSTGNVVAGNIAVGSFTDLYHRELAVDNTWENNKCQKKDGAEIPECTTLFLDGFEYGTAGALAAAQ